MSGAGARADSAEIKSIEPTKITKQDEFDFSVIEQIMSLFDRIDTLVWATDALGCRLQGPETLPRTFLTATISEEVPSFISMLINAVTADDIENQKAQFIIFLNTCEQYANLSAKPQGEKASYTEVGNSWLPLQTGEKQTLTEQFNILYDTHTKLMIAMSNRQFDYYKRFDATKAMEKNASNPTRQLSHLLEHLPLLKEAILSLKEMGGMLLAETFGDVFNKLVDSYLTQTTSDNPNQEEIIGFVNHACISLFIGKQWDHHFLLIKQLIESAINAFTSTNLRDLIERAPSPSKIEINPIQMLIQQLMGGLVFSMRDDDKGSSNRDKARALIAYAADKTSIALAPHEVPPLGNCLWESLVHQMQLVKLESGQSIAETAGITDYKSLKDAIATYLETDHAKKEFSNLGETLKGMQADAKREGVWGGNVHVHFVQSFLNFKDIDCQVIYSQHSFNKPGFESMPSPKNDPEAPILALVYYDRAHYDALVKKDDSGLEQPLTAADAAQLISLDCKDAILTPPTEETPVKIEAMDKADAPDVRPLPEAAALPADLLGQIPSILLPKPEPAPNPLGLLIAHSMMQAAARQAEVTRRVKAVDELLLAEGMAQSEEAAKREEALKQIAKERRDKIATAKQTAALLDYEKKLKGAFNRKLAKKDKKRKPEPASPAGVGAPTAKPTDTAVVRRAIEPKTPSPAALAAMRRAKQQKKRATTTFKQAAAPETPATKKRRANPGPDGPGK